MKSAILFIYIFLNSIFVYTQNSTGQVITEVIHSKALEHQVEDSPDRKVSIYLPPGYDMAITRYPVIYYLHGFMSHSDINDQMKKILDTAILMKKIKPFIFVIPDEFTTYEGSFYSNSSLTGNWIDFTAKELVDYIDQHYKTLANKESRGLGGHSMGGYGTIRIGMMYPDVFGTMYALSPGLLALVKEFSPESDSYKELSKIKTHEELNKTYYPKVIVAVARAWSPNPDHPPFYCDLPFTYHGDSLITNQRILDLWNRNLPTKMVDQYADNLKKYNGIKLDWGRNDFPRFHLQCMMLSQQMEKIGIEHYAEEYIGNHTNKLWTIDGRVLNDFLPFFNDHLKF